MSDYQPAKGDRVRMTFEGVVENVWGDGVAVDQAGRDGSRHFSLKDDGVSIEKLQDPEPQWVNGDVVEVKYYVPAHRIDGKWINPTTGNVHYFSTPSGVHEVPTAYTEGDLKILYKADAA